MPNLHSVAPIDTSYSVETPEGVDILVSPSGLVPRALAYLIDLAIRGGLLLLVYIVLVFAGSVGMGMILILHFLVEWFYPVLFEVFRDGATPGKKRMGLKVVHDDGTPLTFSSSMLRNLLRVVDFMPFGYFAGTLSLCANQQYKRLGDLAAGTVVVYKEELAKPNHSDTQTSDNFVLPKGVQSLSFEQQQAIVEFGERANSFSEARQDELSHILSAILGSQVNKRETLKRSADKLLGR